MIASQDLPPQRGMAQCKSGWSFVFRHQCLTTSTRSQGGCDTSQLHSQDGQPVQNEGENKTEKSMLITGSKTSY